VIAFLPGPFIWLDHMQNLPGITQEEFQQACDAFYRAAIGVQDGKAWMRVSNNHGFLSISKEYTIKGRHASEEVAVLSLSDGNDEDMPDEEDHEVRIIKSSLFDPD
jgi:hypothetical protein